VDQFAVITINAIKDGRTLVVLLIDRSASIVYRDLPKVTERMETYFEAVDKNLTTGIRDRGRWVVYSYGKKAHQMGEASANLTYIQNQLRGVTVEKGGRENVGAAVMEVLDRHGNSGYKHMLLAVMTDEIGDDLKDPKILESVIDRLQGSRARFFVFGYESIFCTRAKLVRIKPSAMKGKLRENYQAFAAERGKKLSELHALEFYSDGGPESPRQELWWSKGWKRHFRHRWGGRFPNIHAGFGMYTLNRIALATRGKYFLLRVESEYDADKLYGKYKPDICSVPKYLSRRQKYPLRRELQDAWMHIGAWQVNHHLHNEKQVNANLHKAAKGRKYCKYKAAQLENMLDRLPRKDPRWGRWEAHAHITIAELKRFRFMLGQYHTVLSRAYREVRREHRRIPKGHRLIVHKGTAPQYFVPDRGPAYEAAKTEYQAAMAYFEKVIREHSNTPWETMAKHIKNRVFPYRCGLHKIPKPRPRPNYKIKRPDLGGV
jgi:hypothetical protein